MKVAVTDYIEDNLDWEAGQFEDAGIEFAVHQLKFLSEDDVVQKIADADVVVVNMVKMTASLLERLPKLKLLIRHGIGYDNVDVEACTRLGIQFAYQPDYCKEDVAEHAIALIFACARKICWSRRILEESSRKGQWDFANLFPIHRMDGKTIGVVGTGRIGSRVVRKLRHFGCRLIACDPYLGEDTRNEIGVTFTDRETLFRTADFITIHTPLNDETRHLVNATSIDWMKSTAYLINTSRGGMVDFEALAQALRNRRIAGAALDVYEVEPPPPDFPFFDLDNVILTPHISWASEEAGWEIRKSIVDDIMACAAGRPARCVVNKQINHYRGEKHA